VDLLEEVIEVVEVEEIEVVEVEEIVVGLIEVVLEDLHQNMKFRVLSFSPLSF
jgi:hypothetical protein